MSEHNGRRRRSAPARDRAPRPRPLHPVSPATSLGTCVRRVLGLLAAALESVPAATLGGDLAAGALDTHATADFARQLADDRAVASLPDEPFARLVDTFALSELEADLVVLA